MMKRVAYLLPSLKKPGGWRSHAIAALRALQKYVSPLLFVSQADYEEARRLFPDCEAVCLPVIQGASLASISGVVRLSQTFLATRRLGEIDFDLVHSLEAYPTGLVGRWLADRCACGHVITTHGTYGVVWQRAPIDRRVYRGVLKRASRVCPVSHGTAHILLEHFADVLPEGRVQPILNGNDFYRRISSQDVQERELPRDGMLLTVGDVKPRKGQHVSLRAFGLAQKSHPNIHYYLAGNYAENEYFHSLQAIISTQGIQNVHFLGAVSDEELDRLYRQASLFLLAPQQVDLHFEGFGLVYLEAGAYGLPVIGTRSGGVADAVRDGETGILAAEDDVHALAAAICRLLEDTALNLRMGHANRRWAETLTWERYAQAQVGVYRQVWGQN